MTSLTLSALNGISPIEQIEWIAGFQNITQLTWECSHGDHHTSIFLRYLREGRWPYLTSLSLNGSQIPDKYLASILKPLSRLKEFHANWTGFGVRAFHVLERSFESSLESLDITYCAGVDDRGLMGRMAQKIFESCNKLRTFKCGMVSAYEFVEGGPWSGCEQSLESLRIYFDFTPRRLTGSGSDVEGSLDAFELPIIDIQRFIFKRLSTLTRLQYINVGYDQKTISGLDFRLSHGMGQLATLKRLYILRLHNLVQQMGEDEVKWILEHWKMLAALQIQMHDNSELDVKLRRQLVAGGIYIYR
ncbi:hypothetical protein BGZ46_005396 [Entomortierella lignicola]|nr:hypothetical protein BGZ46_005396 [Entomortierella lignicola]